MLPPARKLNPASPTFLAALLILGGSLCANAGEAPDNVAAEIAYATQSCKDLEGTPNADAVLSFDDVNEDGGEDWIADYAKLDCEGGINPMCGADGCDLQIFLWNGATAWPLAFEETVKRYRFVRRGGKPALQVVMAGSACDRPSSETCRLTYTLDQDAIERAR
ncbi:MAG: hypothetical protein WBF40_13625 [Methyloceanibacter sp.]